jgi:hypothetical protein
MRTRAISGIAVVLLAGCIPLPHTVTRVPELTGGVTHSGAPVNGAALLVPGSYRENPCRDAVEVAKTGADGGFRLDPQTEFRWTYAPLVAPISVSAYVLCISDGDAPVLGYRGLVFGGDSPPVYLTCDLEKPYLLRGGDGYQDQAVCRPENMGSNPRVESDAIARVEHARLTRTR